MRQTFGRITVVSGTLRTHWKSSDSTGIPKSLPCLILIFILSKMRPPGLEPGSPTWKVRIIPLDHGRLYLNQNPFLYISNGYVFFYKIFRMVTDLENSLRFIIFKYVVQNLIFSNSDTFIRHCGFRKESTQEKKES